jgi:ActR/RegA family two-component response regulator
MEAAFSAFLLSRDPQSLSITKQTCQTYGIQTTACSTSLSAFDVLKRRTFDLLVLDLDVATSAELLELQARHRCNHARDVIVLTEKSQEMTAPLHQRVRNVLQKPFTSDAMANALKTAYSLIVMERRVSFRCAVRINVSAWYRKNCLKQPLSNAMVLDLSQKGLCLKTEIDVPKDTTVFVDLLLPRTTDQIHPMGKVMWSDPHGKAGVQFGLVPQEFAKLRNWLNAQCPWSPELRPVPAKSTTKVAEPGTLSR